MCCIVSDSNGQQVPFSIRSSKGAQGLSVLVDRPIYTCGPRDIYIYIYLCGNVTSSLSPRKATAHCAPLMSSQIEAAPTNQDASTNLRNESSVHLLRDPGKVLGHTTAKVLRAKSRADSTRFEYSGPS